MENHYPKQNNETPIHITYVPNSKENVDYKLKAEYDVTTRAGFPQILIKTSDGWFLTN